MNIMCSPSMCLQGSRANERSFTNGALPNVRALSRSIRFLKKKYPGIYMRTPGGTPHPVGMGLRSPAFSFMSLLQQVCHGMNAVLAHDVLMGITSEVGLIGHDGPNMSHHRPLGLKGVIPCQATTVQTIGQGTEYTAAPYLQLVANAHFPRVQNGSQCPSPIVCFRHSVA